MDVVVLPERRENTFRQLCSATHHGCALLSAVGLGIPTLALGSRLLGPMNSSPNASGCEPSPPKGSQALHTNDATRRPTQNISAYT